MRILIGLLVELITLTSIGLLMILLILRLLHTHYVRVSVILRVGTTVSIHVLVWASLRVVPLLVWLVAIPRVFLLHSILLVRVRRRAHVGWWTTHCWLVVIHSI